MGFSVEHTAQTHERILDESIRLFREKGFSGVSVGEIMKAAGLTHGPFYNHFESKEALITETLTRELRKGNDAIAKLPASASGKNRYVDYYLSESHKNDCRMGCTVAALASQIRSEEQARGPFTEQLKTLIQAFALRFPWRSKRSARGDAIHMYSTLVGALILARAVDDEGFSQEILKEVRKRID
jgi:TetR/AcrR family transcriptional repressor of nem operon